MFRWEREKASAQASQKYANLSPQGRINWDNVPLTLRPRSRISSAFGPRMVTCVEIFSLRRMPKERIVSRDFEKIGVCPVNCSRTRAARVSRSPDSPTQMLRTNLWTLSSRMGFDRFCFPLTIVKISLSTLAECQTAPMSGGCRNRRPLRSCL